MGDPTKTRWLYFPFKNIESDATMPQNRTRYQQKYPNLKGPLQRNDDLAEVKNDDLLIIAGHGLPNKSEMGVAVPREASKDEVKARIRHGKPPAMKFDTIGANDLADLLVASNLDKKHKRIKFIICGGAGIGVLALDDVIWKDGLPQNTIDNVEKVTFSQEKNLTDCFASVFAKAMGERFYGDLRVRAYPGFLNATGLQKYLTIESASNEGFKLTHEVYKQGSFLKKSSFVERETWKEKMMQVPTKAVAEYWFDSSGNKI